MSKRRKIVDKILRKPRPREMEYATIDALLNYFGYYILINDNGSHFSYWKDDIDMQVPLIVVVHHGKVYQFDNIIEQLNLEDWHEEDND